MAQQLEQTNPELINSLRQTMQGARGENTGPNQNTDDPNQNGKMPNCYCAGLFSWKYQ